MIVLENVSRTFGDEVVFSRLSSVIRPGDKIGLVGINGAGKTTLLRLIAGEIEPDEGRIVRPKNIRVAYLPQERVLHAEESLIDYVQKVSRDVEILKSEIAALEALMKQPSSPEHAEDLALQYAVALEKLEHLSGYDLRARAEKILSGLGFPEEWWDRPFEALSGGWIMRAELARLLLSEPDVLLLDEPTNHLDWPSLMWLEEFLRGFKGSVLMVSHDREFLNRVVSRIWELDGGNFYEYHGNYDSYREQREERVRHIMAAYRQQQERIKEIEDFIARNRARKDRARQVQSRLKMLEKMERIEPPRSIEPVEFLFPQPERSGRVVVELRNISKRFGRVLLYQGLNLTVERGNRIAFIGANGTGKSTLLKIIAGEITPDEGTINLGSNVRIGYFSQHRMDMLNPDFTVMEEAFSVSGDLTNFQVRQVLGAFGFGERDLDKKTVVLSGGEKARLCLCKLIFERPNLLLLDEPTNHLDIPSRETLERALRDFDGTLCFVSHDRKFIDGLATHVLYFERGKVEVFPGNYRDFEEIWKSRLEKSEEACRTEKPDHEHGRKNSGRRKRIEAELRNAFYRRKKPLLDEISRIEKEIEAIQREIEHVEQLLSDPETYRNAEKIARLNKRYRELRDENERLTLLWEDKSIKLEELESEFRQQLCR